MRTDAEPISEPPEACEVVEAGAACARLRCVDGPGGAVARCAVVEEGSGIAETVFVDSATSDGGGAHGAARAAGPCGSGYGGDDGRLGSRMALGTERVREMASRRLDE